MYRLCITDHTFCACICFPRLNVLRLKCQWKKDKQYQSHWLCTACAPILVVFFLFLAAFVSKIFWSRTHALAHAQRNIETKHMVFFSVEIYRFALTHSVYQINHYYAKCDFFSLLLRLCVRARVLVHIFISNEHARMYASIHAWSHTYAYVRIWAHSARHHVVSRFEYTTKDTHK